MKTYEVVLRETAAQVFRVEANNVYEARKIFEEFMDSNYDYIDDELESNGNRELEWGPFEEVYHETDIEYPTIIKEYGGFTATYKGVKIEYEKGTTGS